MCRTWVERHRHHLNLHMLRSDLGLWYVVNLGVAWSVDNDRLHGRLKFREGV